MCDFKCPNIFQKTSAYSFKVLDFYSYQPLSRIRFLRRPTMLTGQMGKHELCLVCSLFPKFNSSSNAERWPLHAYRPYGWHSITQFICFLTIATHQMLIFFPRILFFIFTLFNYRSASLCICLERTCAYVCAQFHSRTCSEFMIPNDLLKARNIMLYI